MKHYPKVQAIHKPEAQGFDDGFIIVEEKVDGSQVRIEIDDHGLVYVGSHNIDDIHNTDPGMFDLAVKQAMDIFQGVKADEGEKIIIFGEYLKKPKQNTIAYQRLPRNNIVIFDVIINGRYLDREEKERFAFSYGLECVPILWKGDGKDFTDELREKLLKSKSFLGHQAGYDKVEGIVIKNYNKLYDDRYRNLEGSHMTVKVVNESFQEKNRVENPGEGNKIENLINSFCSEARWKKSIQHLREDGLIKNEMSDLKYITRAVVDDIKQEEEEHIKEQLFKIFWDKIKRRSIKGLPEFYKHLLEEINRNKVV